MQALPGFRDFLPEDYAKRNYIFACWREVARRYGFVEWEGPPLESTELYKKKSGAEIVDQLFNFTDKGEREVALRPELTPTLARVVAAHERQFKNRSNGFRSASSSGTRNNSGAACANIFSSIAISSANRISRQISSWLRFASMSCVRSDSRKKISSSESATASFGQIFCTKKMCRQNAGTNSCRPLTNSGASRARRPPKSWATSPSLSLRL